MFQDYALFPHMNVFDNVAFGLKIKNYPKQKLKKVKEALRLVQLPGYETREISEMSGANVSGSQLHERLSMSQKYCF